MAFINVSSLYVAVHFDVVFNGMSNVKLRMSHKGIMIFIECLIETAQTILFLLLLFVCLLAAIFMLMR